MNPFDKLRDERDKLKAQLATETEIVNRVWKALGIETYEQAKPFAIDEHVAKLKSQLADSEQANAQMRDALHQVVDVGCEFYDMDCGDNGSRAITEATAALTTDAGKGYSRVQYVSECSGLIYDSPGAAGSVRSVVVDGKRYPVGYVKASELVGTRELLVDCTNHLDYSQNRRLLEDIDKEVQRLTALMEGASK